ncbi:HAF repeat-containing protein [Singulisphaera sp. PoT]|uniref:HAF repeat-containing protein n=1 Tax=Singulisphaera sp. PoT TaxID=3411797 RepID=UPI003BF5BAF7
MRFAWFVVASSLTASIAAEAAQPPAKKYEVITPKDNDIIATGMNARGEIIGFEWVESKQQPGVIDQVPFIAKGKEITYLPLLKGYTATFPNAVSDDGVVVGRASKPAPPGVRLYLRNQAFIWDARQGIRGLGVLKDDWASFATGITRDGKRISGFSVGDNRMRACIWNLDGENWVGTPLPHEHQLGSNVVAISDNGKFITAVDGSFPCLWSQAPSGEWAREPIGGSGALTPRAVNNDGTVVGLRDGGNGTMNALVWTRKGGILNIERPKDYPRAEALAINNLGAVVGMIDGAHGSKVLPKGFVYEDGKLRFLDEGGPNFVSATGINDKGQVTGVFEKEEEEKGHAH